MFRQTLRGTMALVSSVLLVAADQPGDISATLSVGATVIRPAEQGARAEEDVEANQGEVVSTESIPEGANVTTGPGPLSRYRGDAASTPPGVTFRTVEF